GVGGTSGPGDAALAVPGGHLELRRLPDGSLRRLVTVAQPVRSGGGRPAGSAGGEPALPLAPGEGGLGTGGGGGISPPSALARAAVSGCTLVVLGRRRAAAEPVVAGLSSLRAQLGLADRVHYVQCDVADPDSVSAAVGSASEHGPVLGLIHGAGVNSPQRM